MVRLHSDFRGICSQIQAEYCTLDMNRVPRIQSLQFAPSADKTAATQFLVKSRRYALSGILQVADCSVVVTLNSPAWVPG